MATVPAPEAQPSIGTFGRVTGALFSPKATFEDIARRPSWLAPLLLICIANVAITAIFSQRVGWRSFMEKQWAENPRMARQMEQMTPEQRQQALERSVKVAGVVGYIGGVAGIFVVALAVAGIFLGAFNLLSGAGLQYKQSLGIVSHGLLPSLIGGLIGILVLFLKDPSTIDLPHLVASNLGAALSSDAPRWLDSLASSLDIFVLWGAILMAIGFSSANPKKVRFGKALGTILGLWALYVLVKVSGVAIFS